MNDNYRVKDNMLSIHYLHRWLMKLAFVCLFANIVFSEGRCIDYIQLHSTYLVIFWPGPCILILF